MKTFPRWLEPAPLAATEVRAALRLTLAALLSYLAASALRLDAPYWAALSAMIVLGESAGGIIHAGWLRVLGTLVGVAVGLALVNLMPHRHLLAACLGVVLATLGCRLVGMAWANCKLAGLTAVMLTLIRPDDPREITIGLARSADIVLGVVVGAALGLLLLPRTAHELARRLRGDVPTTILLLRDVVVAIRRGDRTVPDAGRRVADLRGRRQRREGLLHAARFEPGGLSVPEEQARVRELALVSCMRHVISLTEAVERGEGGPVHPSLGEVLDAQDSLLVSAAEAFGTPDWPRHAALLEAGGERLDEAWFASCRAGAADRSEHHRTGAVVLWVHGALRDLDHQKLDLIVVEAPPASPAWSAVQDRLRRAAA